MIIRYTNGRTIEGVTLARSETTMRVAVQGRHDVILLTNVNGTWLSEDWEPVTIGYGSARTEPAACPVDDEFICSPDLANRLRELLLDGARPQEDESRGMGGPHGQSLREQEMVY
jgi:hypothetical protein